MDPIHTGNGKIQSLAKFSSFFFIIWQKIRKTFNILFKTKFIVKKKKVHVIFKLANKLAVILN